MFVGSTLLSLYTKARQVGPPGGGGSGLGGAAFGSTGGGSTATATGAGSACGGGGGPCSGIATKGPTDPGKGGKEPHWRWGVVLAAVDVVLAAVDAVKRRSTRRCSSRGWFCQKNAAMRSVHNAGGDP